MGRLQIVLHPKDAEGCCPRQSGGPRRSAPKSELSSEVFLDLCLCSGRTCCIAYHSRALFFRVSAKLCQPLSKSNQQGVSPCQRQLISTRSTCLATRGVDLRGR